MTMPASRMRDLPQAAWWQARGFTRELRMSAAAAVLAWPVFALDNATRWARNSIWISSDAVVVADGGPLRVKRALILIVGALAGVVLLAWAVMASPLLCAAALVALLWPLAGALALKAAAPYPKEDRAAGRALGARRKHDPTTTTLELVNIARNPRGRPGSARVLMDQCATGLLTQGYDVACIARTPWHVDYYAAPAQAGHWEPITGHLCTFTPSADLHVRKS